MALAAVRGTTVKVRAEKSHKCGIERSGRNRMERWMLV
jgi:hypothetical protein